MSASFKVVIPARYQSTRFPGKPLADIKGKPMVQHVYERSVESGAEEVIIATDDVRIEEVALGFGAKVCMTSINHLSGSDRLAEVATIYEWDDDQIIVNVQGDEPQIPPENVAQVANNLDQIPEISIATLCTPIESPKEIKDPAIVKVVFDRNRIALYFSRSVIPFEERNDDEFIIHYYRHIGLYAYKASYLKNYTNIGISPLEQSEKLEQLRALWNGEKIHVDFAKVRPGIGVDIQADLKKLL